MRPGEECSGTGLALACEWPRRPHLEAERAERPQLPRVLHPPPLIYQRPGYSYLPPSLSPSSSLGRKVRITHARNLAQHPWYVPGAYVNSEAAQPALFGPAAFTASSGSRRIPLVWLSRCRAGTCAYGCYGQLARASALAAPPTGVEGLSRVCPGSVLGLSSRF